MKRSTLLRRLVEPSPSGRVHDMECSCVTPSYQYEDGTPDGDCPKCHGSGRVATRLSRREAHAVVTYYRQMDKAVKRATEEMRKDILLCERGVYDRGAKGWWHRLGTYVIEEWRM